MWKFILILVLLMRFWGEYCEELTKEFPFKIQKQAQSS